MERYCSLLYFAQSGSAFVTLLVGFLRSPQTVGAVYLSRDTDEIGDAMRACYGASIRLLFPRWVACCCVNSRWVEMDQSVCCLEFDASTPLASACPSLLDRALRDYD